MFAALQPAGKFLIKKPKLAQPRPDNFVFRLHYQYTFGILFVVATLLGSYAYIDTNESAIQCMMDKGVGVTDKVINRYCWMMSTYSMPKYYEGTVGKDVMYHGVGPHGDDDEQVFHAYYQWVPFFLTFQALMFYLPHHIWKRAEGGRFINIMNGMNAEDAEDKKLDELATYFRKRRNAQGRIEHQQWAMKLFACELLNFINVIFQICLTDIFLGGAFSTYGLQAASWVNEESEDRADPLIRVFPRVAKCTFHKFGGSGTIQKFDALCVLGMNILNEKVFIFLWFWFIALAIITGLNLVKSVAQFFIPQMRFHLIRLEEFVMSGTQDCSQLESVLQKLGYHDWLILYYLAQSMEPKRFNLLVKRLALVWEEGGQDEDEAFNNARLSLDDPDATLKSKRKLPRVPSMFSQRPSRDNESL